MLIQPLLILGGAYLCLEGMEKIVHSLLHRKDEQLHQKNLNAFLDPKLDLVAFEKNKIKRGLFVTDFILSAEIIVIGLRDSCNSDTNEPVFSCLDHRYKL